MRAWVTGARAAGYLLVLAAAAAGGAPWAWAQGGPGRTWDGPSLGWSILSTVIFGLIGIVLAIAGYKLFDLVIPFNLEQEICEKQNLPVAILCASVILGISVVIAAAVF